VSASPPNTYEAPTCQGTKEVRAEDAVFRQEIHRQSTTLGVTDLISSASFAGTCLYQTPIEGQAPRDAASVKLQSRLGSPAPWKRYRSLMPAQSKHRVCDLWRDATSWGGARGRGSTRQTRRTYQWLWGRRAAGRQSKHGVAGDADHSRGCARGTSIRCDWPVGFIRVAPVGRRAAPPPPIQSW